MDPNSPDSAATSPPDEPDQPDDDTSPPAGTRQSTWRSRRRILVGTFATAVGAALATQLVVRLDQGVGAIFSDDAPPTPLTVRADAPGCPPLFSLPHGRSVADMQRKVDELTGGDERVMAEHWDRFQEDLRGLGADRLIDELDLVVRSSLTDDVVLKRIRVEVVDRTETTAVSAFSVLGGCGALPEHHYLVDLDEARPRLSPAAPRALPVMPAQRISVFTRRESRSVVIM